MFKVVKVQIAEESFSQYFIAFHSDEKSSVLLPEDVLIKNTASFISTMDGGRKVLKLIEPRKWHEMIKMFWGHSRVNKEVNGNRLLRELGVETPVIYTYGVGLIPSRPYRYVGYVVMDNLLEKGARDASHLLYWNNNLDEDIRHVVYENIISDLKRMRENYLVFSDLTLGNVMVYTDGSVAWIDTGVTLYKGRKRTRIFKEKFNYSVRRFIDIHQHVLTQREMELFCSLLF